MKHYTVSAYIILRPFVNHDLALMCCNHLWKCHEEKRAFIQAFCLMPDHLHLCIDETAGDPEIFVRQWKSFVTHESWGLGWKGKLWQPKSYCKHLYSEEDVARIVTYILDNPVRAGLVKNWREYPYWAEPPYGKRGWDIVGAAVLAAHNVLRAQI